MRVILSGGGTAGHVYPALALADELRAAGHEVIFVGTPDSFEASLVPQKDIPFVPLKAAGFDRSRPHTLVTSSAQVAASMLKAWSWLGRERPDAVVGFGGYVSLPVGFAARLRGIPLYLHEQNSVPGMANRQLAKHAQAVGVTYPNSTSYFPRSSSTLHVGNPVREQVLRARKDLGREQLGIPATARLLLVFGGSRGARHINQALVAVAPQLLTREDLHILHITGEKEKDSVVAGLREQGVAHRVDGATIDAAADAASGVSGARYRVYGYVDDIPNMLAAADAVIARAGATSIAELTALGKPMILVPYPYATEDHQTKNAASCEESGAAFVIADSDLDSEDFVDILTRVLDDPELRATMEAASKQLGVRDAAAKLARLITTNETS